MRRGPSFIVVTLVVTTLCLFAMCARGLQSSIPAPKPNRLIGETAEYLQQGAEQSIDWRPLDDSAFADARRLDKPVFLVIGTPWSSLARNADRDAFSYVELQNYLNRNFICVRVDGFEQPDWLLAYFPIGRMGTEIFRSGFQAWVLDTQGRVYALASKIKPEDAVDHNAMLNMLIAARRDYDQSQRRILDVPELASRQRVETDAIAGAATSAPDFRSHLQSLRQTLGNLPRAAQVWPDAWKYSLLSGNGADFDASAKAFMKSPSVDLLDGGFFFSPDTRGSGSSDYDKVATYQAETMTVLALQGALRHDRLATWLAQRAFDSLTGEFIQGGLVAGCRIGDEEGFNRSRRSSFSARRLERVIADPADRDWAAANLGFDQSSNPGLTPYLASDQVPFGQPGKLQTALGQLRKATEGSRPKFAGLQLLDVNGFVVARLIQVARLWKDSNRLKIALALFDRLDQFRTQDDVAHGLSGRAAGEAYLSDYLAYSDAAFQAYLASGRVVAFDSGLAVLIRARFLFVSDAPGEFVVSQNPVSPLLPKGTHVPEIGDSLCESCTSRMIRLCNAYGRLLLEESPRKGSKRDSGLSLLQTAFATIGRFADIANAAGPAMSSYFCAAAVVQDNGFAVTVGPHAQDLADDLGARLPSRLVAPSFGPIRQDLQHRGAGVYVLQDKGIVGPVTVDQAATMLGVRLKVGD